MKFEIVYSSKTGSTERVAHALAEMLSSNQCRVVNIDREKPSYDADAYLIGFGVRKGSCPFNVLEWMEELGGKKIMLFATCGLAILNGYQRKIETLVTSFLPEQCEYLGFFLCQGKITQEGYAYLEGYLTNPDGSSTRENLQQLYVYSQNHPDEQDLQNAQEFLQNVL